MIVDEYSFWPDRIIPDTKLGNLVDMLNKNIHYEWNENNELLIDFNFNYSNGIIIFNECKYFEVVIKVTQYDYYFVESTKCILHCE